MVSHDSASKILKQVLIIDITNKTNEKMRVTKRVFIQEKHVTKQQQQQQPKNNNNNNNKKPTQVHLHWVFKSFTYSLRSQMLWYKKRWNNISYDDVQ